MKTKILSYPTFLFIFVCLILIGCKKEPVKTEPVITVSEVINITATAASAGGEVTADGGASIIMHGVCWSKNQNPTITDNKTSDGAGSGSFVSHLTGLTEATTYYLKAYATNSIGTGYSNQLYFTTLALAPVVTTTGLSAITSTSAKGGGIISSDGGSSITARGVCWSTGQNPTTSDNKTTDGTGTGSFTSDIGGLIAGTDYYIRAYATNSIGTSYGNELKITTPAPIAIEWVAPAGNIISVAIYAGGSLAGEYRHQKFNVLNASGEITIVLQEPTLNLSKTVVFNVEMGKQYKMIATINYSAQAGGIPTSTKCQTFVFSSPNCNTTKEIFVYQLSFKHTIFIPPNSSSTYYTYECPSSYSIGDISISLLN